MIYYCTCVVVQVCVDQKGFALLVLELCPKTVPGSIYKMRGRVWAVVDIYAIPELLHVGGS